MRKLLAAVAVVAVLFAIAVASALAAGNPSPTGTGQPSQTCPSDNSLSPGNAGNAPGSAFNEVGPGTAGPLYAGNGATTNTPANGAAVSQYDVACFKHH
jgi:hypothetical protein